MSQQMLFDCRFAGRSVQHETPPGRLAIAPAGLDIAANTEEGLDAVFVTVDPGQLALAAAENSAIDVQVIERFIGYDQTLLDHARTLAAEAAAHYPNGPLFWNEVASGFIGGLLTRHTSGFDGRARGRLDNAVFKRLKDYIMAHLDEPVQVATLAKIAGRSPFHFSRVFTRSVGVTPHRYIVHLRLKRAVELIRDGEFGLADIALSTGFADQNHLCHWVRRVYGVTLRKLS
jgi:AraC family transcriptional regulator